MINMSRIELEELLRDKLKWNGNIRISLFNNIISSIEDNKPNISTIWYKDDFYFPSELSNKVGINLNKVHIKLGSNLDLWKEVCK